MGIILEIQGGSMKIKFIEDTKNIRNMKDALGALQSNKKGLPGLGLICGKAGLGKTQAVKWYSTQFDCPYIRATATWTPRWMLQEICCELDQDPEGYTAKVFNQVKTELQIKPRLIFIDEADYLTSNWKLLETLRDLHDLTGSSFVLIGMGNIKSRLAKKRQFWSRISQVIEFRPLSSDEVAFIAQELAELNLNDNVAKEIVRATAGYFRDVMVVLLHLERTAQANNRQDINKKMVDMISRTVLKRKAA
jgi:DNA transposition AAA+ family ATPase